MNNVLRQELGFEGVVQSEGDGFQTLIDEDIVPTQKEAGALALKAGVDLNITYEPAYMGPLRGGRGRGKSSHGAGGSRCAQGSQTEVPPGII